MELAVDFLGIFGSGTGRQKEPTLLGFLVMISLYKILKKLSYLGSGVEVKAFGIHSFLWSSFGISGLGILDVRLAVAWQRPEENERPGAESIV